MWAGRPRRSIPPSCAWAAGNRSRVWSRTGATVDAVTASQEWVATERPAARSAAKRKYCVR
eukprot:10436238-Lingulodinium_polyedra.AAC.1